MIAKPFALGLGLACLLFASGCGSQISLAAPSGPSTADAAELQQVRTAVGDGLFYQKAVVGTDAVTVATDPAELAQVAQRYRYLARQIDACSKQDQGLAGYDEQVARAEREDALANASGRPIAVQLADAVSTYQAAFSAIATDIDSLRSTGDTDKGN